MPQIQYIATCVKTDSIRGVGLQWNPGQVRNVTAEVAERLLAYPDTWAAYVDVDANEVDAKKDVDVTKGADTNQEHVDDEIGLSKEEIPAEEPLPVIDFHAMDKKAMVEFAETKYNVRLDLRKSEEVIRHRVIDLFSKHELDNEAAQ